MHPSQENPTVIDRCQKCLGRTLFKNTLIALVVLVQLLFLIRMFAGSWRLGGSSAYDRVLGSMSFSLLLCS